MLTGDEANAVEQYTGQADEPAHKRHKPLSKVCETCRVKKSRCDNERPQCGTCRRKGVGCHYREKGQPGLRPGYGKNMENRLYKLETNMDEVNSSLKSFLEHLKNNETSQSHIGQAGQQQVQSSRLQNPSPQVEEVNDAIANAGLWETPPPVPTVDAAGDFTDLAGAQQTPSGGIDQPCISNNLPPAYAMRELVDVFFDKIYPWCPLFHQVSFIDNMFDHGRELLLHGIVVASSRFYDFHEQSEDARERYVNQSRQHILLNTIGVCTLVSTQALALLALDALGQGTGPRAWNTMSMLATAARHLGLATNPALSNPVTESNTPLVRNDDDDVSIFPSIIDAEERVRLFWTICMLDRFSSVAHGVPGGISTRTIRMSYPKADSDWANEIAMPVFDGRSWTVPDSAVKDSSAMWLRYLDLMALADRCNQLLIQPVNLFDVAQCQQWQNSFRELDNTLEVWYASLPDAVRARPVDFNPIWYLLHANLYLARLRMYTVAAFPSTASPHVRPSTTARVRCRNAAKEVSSLAKSVPIQNISNLGPMFAFVVWVAARSLIILQGVGEDVEALQYILRELGRNWQSANRYNDLIQLVLDTKDSPGGQSHLQIFSDTRRTAYGLEKCLGSLAERRDAAIQPTAFDFLDMPFLDADTTGRWNGLFRLDGNGELF